MLRRIVLITLLISSACALHWEMHIKESIGNQLEESSVRSLSYTEKERLQKAVELGNGFQTASLQGEIQTEQLPGLCWACKWAMGKLKKQISNGTTAVEIKKKLENICDRIGFLKSLCRKFVNKYMGTLIEELSTTDDAKTICINIRVCKKKE